MQEEIVETEFCTVIIRTRVKIDVPDDIEILQLAKDHTPAGWSDCFTKAIPALKIISVAMKKHERTHGLCYPRRRDIFRAFHLTPLKEVKVVIVGQDPYHQTTRESGLPVATGMSFSVRDGAPINKSLQVIFEELRESIPDFQVPSHGDLTHWAMQGVLLLNTCLTVDPGKAASHGIIWKTFIYQVLMAIAAERPTAVIVLWGKKAQTLRSIVPKMKIIMGPHPVGGRGGRGVSFKGCNHFNLINEWLEQNDEEPIDWNI